MFWDRVRQHTTKLTVAAVVIGAWILAHIYYYNWLYDLETNVQMSYAHIQATEQKRNHIQRNLVRLVRYHAQYERSVMTDLTELRAAEKPAKAETAQQLLARLDAVAEQYPNLNLGGTVDQFSNIIASTEAEIADRIVQYNEAVNVYTTALGQFPANIFAKPLGFGHYDYYRPKDPSVVEYREVKP